jgi:hypothetical protein
VARTSNPILTFLYDESVIGRGDGANYCEYYHELYDHFRTYLSHIGVKYTPSEDEFQDALKEQRFKIVGGSERDVRGVVNSGLFVEGLMFIGGDPHLARAHRASIVHNAAELEAIEDAKDKEAFRIRVPSESPCSNIALFADMFPVVEEYDMRGAVLVQGY